MSRFGVVTGTPSTYGYGAGAASMYQTALPGPYYPAVPYPAQLYGRSSEAELRHADMGSWFSDLVAGVKTIATDVENVSRGVATASTAVQAGSGSAGTLFQPSAADLAAQQADLAALMGGSAMPYVLIGGGLLLLIVLARR